MKATTKQNDKSIKVMLLIPYLSGNGGTETVVRNLQSAVKERPRSEWTWRLFSYGGTSNSEWIKDWSAKIYNFSRNRFMQDLCYLFIMPFLMLRDLRDYSPNVVISTNPVIWFMASIIRRLTKKNYTVVAWYHYSFRKKPIKKLFLRSADCFLAISSGIKQELTDLGIDAKHIFLVYNPVPPYEGALIPRSDSALKIVYVGRIDFDEQKNVSELFKGLAQLDDKIPWQCDLYGAVSDNTVRRLYDLLPMDDQRGKIHFHGFVNNVWNQIAVADVLVLCSQYEGFGMVLCEAAVHGIAIVSSDCPSGPDDIVTKENGCLYRPSADGQLAAILRNYAIDRDSLPTPLQTHQSINRYSFANYEKRLFDALVNFK